MTLVQTLFNHLMDAQKLLQNIHDQYLESTVLTQITLTQDRDGFHFNLFINCDPDSTSAHRAMSFERLKADIRPKFAHLEEVAAKVLGDWYHNWEKFLAPSNQRISLIVDTNNAYNDRILILEVPAMILHAIKDAHEGRQCRVLSYEDDTVLNFPDDLAILTRHMLNPNSCKIWEIDLKHKDASPDSSPLQYLIAANTSTEALILANVQGKNLYFSHYPQAIRDVSDKHSNMLDILASY